MYIVDVGIFEFYVDTITHHILPIYICMIISENRLAIYVFYRKIYVRKYMNHNTRFGETRANVFSRLPLIIRFSDGILCKITISFISQKQDCQA